MTKEYFTLNVGFFTLFLLLLRFFIDLAGLLLCPALPGGGPIGLVGLFSPAEAWETQKFMHINAKGYKSNRIPRKKTLEPGFSFGRHLSGYRLAL